eukprot:5867798-Alexandrium_andersonii.AAC.1
MSASLVGSEMCIRDSFLWQSIAGQILRPRVVAQLAVVGPEVVCDRHEPVSYTHLTLPTICSV